MKIVELPERPCPHCRAVFDAAVQAAGKKNAPGVGDYTVCGECSAVLKYGEGMTLLSVPAEEWIELDAEFRSALRTVQEIVRDARRVIKESKQ